VVLLDVSYSMGIKGPSGKTLMDTGKDGALAVVQALGEGDRVAVLTMGSDAETVLKPDEDRNKAISEIRKIELTDGSTNLTAGLEAAIELLEGTDAGSKMTYIITDLQGSSWKPKGAPERLEKAIKRLTDVGKVTIIDANIRPDKKAEDVDNCAIVELDAKDELIAEGMPAQFTASIVNYSGREMTVTAEWEIVGVHKEHPQDVALPADREPITTEWKHTFQKNGSYRAALRIKEKGLPAGIPADDDRHLAVVVRQAIDVLVIQGGSPDLDLFEREADFLLFALLPEEGSPDERISVANRKVLPEGEIVTARFSEYDVVVLANVRMVPEKVAKKIEKFVREGGGLLVFLGDNVDAGAYNQHLYQEGKGFLPAQLTTKRGPEKDSSGQDAPSVGLDPLEHPLTTSMRSDDYGEPTDVMIRTYTKVKDPGKVVCRYTDGAPAIIQEKFGRGSVVLVTTACDRDWGNFPILPLYAPFVHDSIRHLLRKQQTNVLVGEKWTKVLSESELGYPVTVTAPGGKGYAVQPEAREEDTVVVYDRTDRRGFYRVTIGDGGEMTFAANVDTGEGLPERLSDKDIKSLFPDFKHRYLESSQDVKKAVIELMAGSEITKALLYLALLLACAEVVLAYVFRRTKTA
jgi:hypothetical protein